MNTTEFLFMLGTVFGLTSVITVFRYIIYKIASDEYIKNEKKHLTTTRENVIL